MTLQQINYILTIERTGSMNRAAEELYISQPALTSSIHDLEGELGFAIFNRTNRGVTTTNDGRSFLFYARQLYEQYEMICDQFKNPEERKIQFAVSTQHYSFAVSAFVETVRKFGTEKFDFTIRETRTKEVIDDVSTGRSEIGILYLSQRNRRLMEKLLRDTGLDFTPLIQCSAYVYLWGQHPLAQHDAICMDDLAPYPCLCFEQGENSSAFFSEEILSEKEYPQIIRANDRATMLNLMIGVLGYTLCSGIICEELNGNAYKAIPFAEDAQNRNTIMEIGYITRKRTLLSPVGEAYIAHLRSYLSETESRPLR